MWEEVKGRIEEDRYFDIEVLKLYFCKEHDIKWKCHCLLCEAYYDNPCSSECPLMRKAMKEHGDYMKEHDITCGCSNKIASDYAIVLDIDRYFDKGTYTLAKRLKAIDNIIKAIKEA